jgi:hypothetical protein
MLGQEHTRPIDLERRTGVEEPTAVDTCTAMKRLVAWMFAQKCTQPLALGHAGNRVGV